MSLVVKKDSFPRLINKYVMFLFTIAIVSVFISSVLFYPDFLFGGFNLDSYSLATLFLLFVITIIILVTGHIYKKRAKETFQINLNYLANGSLIVLVSNLVYFSNEFSGHFLIITGFVYFYLGLYKNSVEMPYERLAISEEKLRHAAEDKYHRLFDNANDAIVTLDMDGHVTSWNKSAEKIFGITAEEITGKRFVEALATPETVAQKEKMIFELFSDTIQGQETTCICRDGTKLDVSVTISPVLDINNNVVERSLIIRDITENKKSDLALRKSEKFSRTILNSMNDSIMVIDAYDFSIVSVNSYLLKKYGLKVEEVIGKKCFEVSHHINEPCYLKNELCPLLDSVKTGKYSTFEHVHFGKNGKKIYAEVSTAPIKDDTGKVVQIIHVTKDISERKQMEQALQISEEKFLKSFRSSPISLTLTRVEDGVLVEANKAFEDITGYSVMEALGKTANEINLFPFPHERENLVEMLKNKRQIRNIEMHLRHKSGQHRTVQSCAELIIIDKLEYILSTTEDITERKRAEEKLRESEAKFRTIFEGAAIGMAFTEFNIQSIISNPALRKMLGYGSQKLTLDLISELTHPEDRETDLILFNELIGGKRDSYQIEKRYLRKDGIMVFGQLTLSLIRGDNNEPRFIVSMLEDITERKLYEEKIRKSLEEKEVLLREIHHRVKNNMQIVSSLLMLQSQNIEDKKYKDMFIESQTRIFSMALIHEKLYQSESIAQINFKEYIEGIISNIFESYRIKSNIRIDIKVENIPIKIDYAIPCGLIINELITNSLKYAFPDERHGNIQIILKSIDNNMILLSISDDGIGIAKDLDIRNTKSLGLHLVTALAEGQLRGNIILNRERGTEFQIIFGAK